MGSCFVLIILSSVQTPKPLIRLYFVIHNFPILSASDTGIYWQKTQTWDLSILGPNASTTEL